MIFFSENKKLNDVLNFSHVVATILDLLPWTDRVINCKSKKGCCDHIRLVTGFISVPLTRYISLLTGYNFMYRFSLTCGRLLVSSSNEINYHNIYEIYKSPTFNRRLGGKYRFFWNPPISPWSRKRIIVGINDTILPPLKVFKGPRICLTARGQ
jgi:hypothetical protein